MKNPLPRFVIVTLAWLPVTFAVWYLAAPLLLLPVEWIVAAVARAGFADIVREVSLDGSTITIDTMLRAGQSVAGGYITILVDGLLYAFGLPLFAALSLAAREPRWLRHLAIGYLVLVPFVAWGVAADFLRHVAITSGPLVASQTGFSALQREAIVFAYQFGSLILPTVVPAALWVALHRSFLERLRGGLSIAEGARQERDAR